MFQRYKPAKYRVKTYGLMDARMFCMQNLEIYCGKQAEGEFKVDNSASAIVKHLAKPILNTGRNITIDNYFTSISLALEPLEHKITIVGSIQKNKKGLPPSFLNVNNPAIGGIICQIIFKLNTGIVEEQKVFLKQVALDLMKCHLYATSQQTKQSNRRKKNNEKTCWGTR